MDLGEKGAGKRLRGWEGENWDCDIIFERRIKKNRSLADSD